MRTFVSVEVPEDIRTKVGLFSDSLKDFFKNDVKWVLPKNLHFTIKFLGEISESALSAVQECVSNTAAEFGPFLMSLSNVGFFPSARNPRVIWIGTHEGADKLLELFQELESCLEHEGFDRDTRTFFPHLTIGRVRKYSKIIIPETLPDFEPVMYDVKGIVVIRSTLTPKGPVYERVFESDLNKSFKTDNQEMMYRDILPND